MEEDKYSKRMRTFFYRAQTTLIILDSISLVLRILVYSYLIFEGFEGFRKIYWIFKDDYDKSLSRHFVYNEVKYQSYLSLPIFIA